MAWNVGQLYVRIVAFPTMPVASAHACAFDFNHHTMPLRAWIGDIHQARWLRKGFVDDSFHDVYPC